MKKTFITLCALALMSSCYYDNASELYPEGALKDCDSVAITYTNYVAPLFSTNCGTNNSCHSAAIAEGGIILDTYSSAAAVDTTTLLGCIEHLQGFSPMPPSGKMGDCGINQIKIWVRTGKPL